MELIDIIKSSVILFSFSLLMVLIISYALYKIRNQAKIKYLGYFNRSEGKKLNRKVKTENKSKPTDLEEKYPNDSEIKRFNKFIVVNEELKSQSINNLQLNPQPNIYKFYEEFNSKIMFKIKSSVNAE